MNESIIEAIEKEAEKATATFATEFRNGGFDKFESHNHGPNYKSVQSGKASSMLSEDETFFMEFLSTPIAKNIMGLE